MPRKKKVTHTHTPDRTGKRCVGELCWNPNSGKLEFTFDRESCPPEIVEHLEVRTPMIIKEKPKKEE
jgi:hypothetical protein